MSKQQTAVEILIDRIKIVDKQIYWQISEDLMVAKEMEKEQIKAAYNQGYREVEEDCCKEVGPDIANFANAEDYYNQTYQQ